MQRLFTHYFRHDRVSADHSCYAPISCSAALYGRGVAVAVVEYTDATDAETTERRSADPLINWGSALHAGGTFNELTAGVRSSA
jgi:hypothetical protein